MNPKFVVVLAIVLALAATVGTIVTLTAAAQGQGIQNQSLKERVENLEDRVEVLNALELELEARIAEQQIVIDNHTNSIRGLIGFTRTLGQRVTALENAQ